MKTLDNLLLRKLLLHIPADYRWMDEGIVRIGAERDIATSSISSARSMFRCLSTSFKGNDWNADMNCLAVASLRLGRLEREEGAGDGGGGKYDIILSI